MTHESPPLLHSLMATQWTWAKHTNMRPVSADFERRSGACFLLRAGGATGWLAVHFLCELRWMRVGTKCLVTRCFTLLQKTDMLTAADTSVALSQSKQETDSLQAPFCPPLSDGTSLFPSAGTARAVRILLTGTERAPTGGYHPLTHQHYHTFTTKTGKKVMFFYSWKISEIQPRLLLSNKILLSKINK